MILHYGDHLLKVLFGRDEPAHKVPNPLLAWGDLGEV
jgi:hypothetical protein